MQGKIVPASDLRCKPCTKGSLVPVALLESSGIASLDTAGFEPPAGAAEGTSSSATSENPSLVVVASGAVVGVVALAAIALAAFAVLRRRRSTATGARSLPSLSALGLDADDTVAEPPADIAVFHAV